MNSIKGNRSTWREPVHARREHASKKRPGWIQTLPSFSSVDPRLYVVQYSVQTFLIAKVWNTGKKIQLGKFSSVICYLTRYGLLYSKLPTQQCHLFSLTLIGCTPSNGNEEDINISSAKTVFSECIKALFHRKSWKKRSFLNIYRFSELHKGATFEHLYQPPFSAMAKEKIEKKTSES